MKQVYEIGQVVTVQAIKITDGEKSHCFSIGSSVKIAGERVPHNYISDNGDLYLCSNGEIEQYLWTSEFN